MASGDDYVLKAAEFRARAECEADPETRTELENMARAYLRLAAQAKSNALLTSRSRHQLKWKF
jgi:hypothetical protein